MEQTTGVEEPEETKIPEEVKSSESLNKLEEKRVNNQENH